MKNSKGWMSASSSCWISQTGETFLRLFAFQPSVVFCPPPMVLIHNCTLAGGFGRWVLGYWDQNHMRFCSSGRSGIFRHDRCCGRGLCESFTMNLHFPLFFLPGCPEETWPNPSWAIGAWRMTPASRRRPAAPSGCWGAGTSRGRWPSAWCAPGSRWWSAAATRSEKPASSLPQQKSPSRLRQ